MNTLFEFSQFLANVSVTIALIVTFIGLCIEIRKGRKAREYESFLVLLQNYKQIVAERQKHWKKIKQTLKNNPKVSREIHDKQDSLSYLLIRQSQIEPMYPIEHELLDKELRSLNFLNKLCELASKNNRVLDTLLLTDAHEISYYHNKLKDLLKLYEGQKNIRLFPKPRYNWLSKTNITDYFG